ncbi:MAG: hypothetical protein LBV69_09405 [Bacteroidales bacterium]|jgi:IS30 family transposase|nr:hypothetical protein [Bacteroidales bacterium]
MLDFSQVTISKELSCNKNENGKYNYEDAQMHLTSTMRHSKRISKNFRQKV